MIGHKNILVLAPHTDDGELGCGATLARALSEGSSVHYVAFSTAEASVPLGFPRNQLEIEVREATAILGIPQQQLIVYKYEVRKLNYIRQEILEQLVHLRSMLSPDLVFLPSSQDIHQDHLVVAQEGLRAFKQCSILGYELIWNNRSFDADCFVPVTEAQVDRKIEALQAYKTQAGKTFMQSDFLKAMARVRGTQIGVPFAEAFEVVRWIV